MQLWRITMAALLGLVTLATATVPAGAAIISRTYEFTVANVASFPAVSGSVTVTFDDGASIVDSAVGITLNALSMPLDSQIAFTYDKPNDRLFIGGLGGSDIGVGTVRNIAAGQNDFILWIQAPGSTADFVIFARTSSDPDRSCCSYGGSGGIVSVVPEPASLALLGAGLFGLGLTRRRRPA